MKWFLGFLGLLATGSAGALIYAPYLPDLIAEGVPGVIYSGQGQYVAIGNPAEPSPLTIAPDAATRPLESPVAEVFAGQMGEALLVYRDGMLSLEHYAGGAGPQTRFNSFSMAKSLVGGLVFKALADGRISSLDQPLSAYLPQTENLGGVTLRSLLTMRSGIAFDGGGSFGSVAGKQDDTSPNPFGALARLHYTGLDRVVPTLAVDREKEDQFNYENINTALLGALVSRVYGKPLPEVLSDQIWRPAGASEALWRRPPNADDVSAYCCIYATARDWIRVGRYINANGTPDAPFLPDALWRDYLGLEVPMPARQANNYGLHVWQNVLDRSGQELQGPFSYFMGQFGQTLYLMPDKGLVVYRAGEGVPLLHSTLYGAWNSSRQPPLPNRTSTSIR